MINLRIQSLFVTLRERAVQLFGVASIVPGRAESAPRIKLLKLFGESDARPVDRGLIRNRPCVELGRDGLRERVALRRRRLREN